MEPSKVLAELAEVEGAVRSLAERLGTVRARAEAEIRALRPKPTRRQCRNCGQTFEPKKRWGKFCKKECRWEFNNKRREKSHGTNVDDTGGGRVPEIEPEDLVRVDEFPADSPFQGAGTSSL